MNNNYKNLIVGQEFKNYKELCIFLNEDENLLGNSKKSQEKEFRRYFDFEKIGNSRRIRIKNVYGAPLNKENNYKGGNNSVKYIDVLESLILDMLSRRKADYAFISINNILNTLKMVNEEYIANKYTINKLSKKLDIPVEEIRDFYTTSDSVLKSNVETALKRLSNKSLVIWNHTTCIAIVNTEVEFRENFEIAMYKKETIDEFGDTTIEFNSSEVKHRTIHRKATKDEKTLIITLEKDTLLEMGCATKHQAFREGKRDEFYKKVNKKLFEKTNIYMYYTAYEINFNSEYIEDELEKNLFKMNDYTLHLNRLELNEGVMERLYNNAENRHKRTHRNHPSSKKEVHKMRLALNYILNFSKLLDTLIMIENNDKIREVTKQS